MPPQIDSLTDEEILAVADRPELLAKFTAEEKVRLGRLRAGHSTYRPRHPAAPIDPLTDAELLAVGDHPDVAPKLTNEERVRLGRLRASQPPRLHGPTGREAEGAVRNFVSNAARTLLPSTTPSDYVEGPLYAIQHPIESAKLVGSAIADAHRGTATKAMERGRAAMGGDLSAIPEALGYGAATVLPLVGPAAAAAGEQIGAGDVAGGLGPTAGLFAPSAARGAAQATTGVRGRMTEALANKADTMSTARLTDAAVPKVGANKVRIGNDFQKIAPKLAREEGLGAASREGLQGKIDIKLAEAEAALDAASNARNAKKVYPTKPLIDELKKRVGRRTAPSASAGGVKAGVDVVPAPNRARVAQVEQAISELEQLGPYASYEALRRVREAYDGPAKAIYSQSMTADYLAKSGEKMGAADVTGVLREKLAAMDPRTAKANADYSLYKTASDVLRATEEVQRTRPTTGRKMLTSAITGSLGSTIDPGVGTAIGIALGPLVDEALNAGLTTKITTARLLAQMADALRGNQPKRAQALVGQIRNVLQAGRKTSIGAGRVQSGHTAPRQRAP